MKLVRPEEHSGDLSGWFSQRMGTPVVSSVLIEVELLRATRRSAPARVAHALEVLRGIAMVTLSPSVIARAVAYLDPWLRSIDAIHLAAAEHVAFVARQPLEAFVGYDERLLNAARQANIRVAAPGLS